MKCDLCRVRVATVDRDDIVIRDNTTLSRTRFLRLCATCSPAAGTTVVIDIPIPPHAKARARVGAGKGYNPKSNSVFDESVAYAAAPHLPKKAPEGPVVTDLLFLFPHNERSGPHTFTPDGDNCEKAVLDALNGIAWKDDRQIYKSSRTKLWAREPLVRVSITYEGEKP